MGEFDVRPFGKRLAVLDKRAERIDELEPLLVDEGHGMGIAHGYAGESKRMTVDEEIGIERDTAVWGLGSAKRRRDLRRLQYGSTHVDSCLRELSVGVEGEADGLGAGERVSDEAAGLGIDDSAIDEELREAAYAVAAHLRPGSIGVVIIHVGGTFGTWRGFDDDHPVASDAKMPVAKRRDLLGGEKYLIVEVLDHHKIVADAVELREIVSHVRTAPSISSIARRTSVSVMPSSACNHMISESRRNHESCRFA